MRLTLLHQYYKFQRRHLCPLHVHPTRQIDHVRDARLRPAPVGLRPRPPRRALRRKHTRPDRTRYDRPEAPAAWRTLVSYKELPSRVHA